MRCQQKSHKLRKSEQLSRNAVRNNMQPTKIVLISLTAASTSCASYTLPQPADFTPAQTLAVEGGTGINLDEMTVGNYNVQIDRSWTRERSEDIGVVRDRSKRQGYSFVIKQSEATVFTGGCAMEVDATGVGAPAGVEIAARQSSKIECEMLPRGTGRDSWKLDLRGQPNNPMTGNLIGNGSTYTVEGLGISLGNTKYGPTGGYYIKQGDRTIATVQITGKRQVLFAPGAQSDPLLAAAIALLLIDEQARGVD
jgi:hypothetical protein